MNLLLLTDGIYPYTIGGMQKHSYYLAKFLAREGISIDVVIPNRPAKAASELEDHLTKEELQNLTFIEVEKPRAPYFPGHYIYESYKYSENIYNIIAEQVDRYDFIYAQGFSAWKLLSEKRGGFECPPTGVNFHGLEMFQITDSFISKAEQYLFRSPTRYCLKNADYAYSLGGKLTEIIKKESEGEPIVWETPIGIEEHWLEETDLSTGSIRKFVFIGRYEKRKGIELLHEVIKKNSSFNFRFDFIGPIPEEKRISHPKATYHGAIYEEEQIIKILDESDVLFCPSYSEGMPTVILEAMARGVAVVATDVGAVSCLVSDKTGWLLPPGNLSELDGAFKQCLNIPVDELHEKKKNAQMLIQERYTWTKTAEVNISKIKTVLNGSLAGG